MNKYAICTFVILATIAALLAHGCAESNPSKTARDTAQLAYHDHPGIEPLPSTLNPAQFKADHTSFVAYTLAGQIKNMLYQVPCYCPCHKQQGHESLLDCFTGRHGVKCPTCQKELIFCFRQQRRGKSPAEVRDEMKRGQAWKVNLAKETEHFYKQFQSIRK
jgi:hypothetical protein